MTPPGPGKSIGAACLSNPLQNKGTAFTPGERSRLGIDGLLPPRVESLEEQVARVLASLREKATPREKYRYLSALQAGNETLFYRVLTHNLEELLPVVYTPTAGQACLEWSRIYERPRGLYICTRHRGRIAEVLGNWPQSRVGIIVVTDGDGSSGLATSARTVWGYPWASSRSIRLAPACTPRSACRSRSTSAPTTQRCRAIPSILASASAG